LHANRTDGLATYGVLSEKRMILFALYRTPKQEVSEITILCGVLFFPPFSVWSNGQIFTTPGMNFILPKKIPRPCT